MIWETISFLQPTQLLSILRHVPSVKNAINSRRFHASEDASAIRKATKKEDLYNEDKYNKDICMDYEIEKLGSSITYKSIWDTIGEKEYLDIKIKIDSITEKIDKKGNMMAFIKTSIDKKELNGIVFASIYCNNTDKIFKDNTIEAQIIKESKDKFTIKKIL